MSVYPALTSRGGVVEIHRPHRGGPDAPRYPSFSSGCVTAPQLLLLLCVRSWLRRGRLVVACCVCVVWCCCCKSMPSYFLIPSIAVLFCYWHQTPPATPLLCCLSPRPAAQTKQQPPQQARSRQQPAGQHAAIYRASSAVRLRGFVAPSSAGLDRAVAVFGRRGSCCPTTSCGS